MDNKDREALFNRGNIKVQQHQPQTAIKDYDAAIAISPTYAAAFYGRGLVKSQLGNTAGSVEDYSKAIEFNPEFAEAYDNRGLAYMTKLNKRERACSDWQKACKLGRCGNLNLAKSKKLCM